MTAKEFLEDKTLSAVETVDGLILNLIVDKAVYGMDIDTSNIKSGTPIVRTTEFVIIEDTLSSGDISVDLSTTDMLNKKSSLIETKNQS